MSNNIHKLTKRQTMSFKEPGRYNDGGGLYLHVRKSGSKSWIYRYRSDGRLREVGLGSLTEKSGLNQAINDQIDSPHELQFLPNTGHVPTNKAGPANDLVDNFIGKVRASNPPPF